MHLHLDFSHDQVRGEGTDFVGPWQLSGNLPGDNRVRWCKQYLGRHRVDYQGVISGQSIRGTWEIGYGMGGVFQIWPRAQGEPVELIGGLLPGAGPAGPG